MLNCIPSSRYNENVFHDFTNSHDENFFITKPRDTEISNKTSHKRSHLGIVIGISALLAVSGVLVLCGGRGKSVPKYLEKIKDYLEKKSVQAGLGNSDNWKALYNYSLRLVNNFVEKAQSINNWVSLKDTLFKKFMGKNSNTKKIHQGITDFFEKISRSTITDSYKKTGKKFKQVFTSFENLDKQLLHKNPNEIIEINGERKTIKQWIGEAQTLRKKIKGNVDSFISTDEQSKRYGLIKSSMTNLYSQVEKEVSTDFWSKHNIVLRKEFWQKFIAQEKIKPNQQLLAKNIAMLRKNITYSSADKSKLIKTQLKELELLIRPNDIEGLNLIKELKYYSSLPDGIDKKAGIFRKKLNEVFEKHLPKGVEQNKLSETYKKSILGLLDDNNSGDLQKMLEIYEEIAPYELSAIRPQVTKAIKSFDKSINLETVEFVGKLRDLSLGSAPTDILSILASGGLITYGLTKAKDSDERISVALKSGIPIIGAVGTAMLCTTKLISGSKALLFAALSGLVLNKFGVFTDNIRHRYSKDYFNNPAHVHLA